MTLQPVYSGAFRENTLEETVRLYLNTTKNTLLSRVDRHIVIYLHQFQLNFWFNDLRYQGDAITSEDLPYCPAAPLPISLIKSQKTRLLSGSSRVLELSKSLNLIKQTSFLFNMMSKKINYYTMLTVAGRLKCIYRQWVSRVRQTETKGGGREKMASETNCLI